MAWPVGNVRCKMECSKRLALAPNGSFGAVAITLSHRLGVLFALISWAFFRPETAQLCGRRRMAPPPHVPRRNPGLEEANLKFQLKTLFKVVYAIEPCSSGKAFVTASLG